MIAHGAGAGRGADRRGVGLVELLIALAIGGVVLGVTAAFYGQQTRVTRETQARNDANLRARGVLEAIVQDVRMAGARAAVDASGRTAFRRELPCDASNSCITVARSAAEPETEESGGESGAGGQAALAGVIRLQVQYVSSLFLDPDVGVSAATAQGVVVDVCRTVTYDLVGTTLYRSDVECGDEPLDDGFATEFARDVVSIGAAFVCSEDATSPVGDPTTCFGDSALEFVREARVDVVVESPRDPNLTVELSSATTTPNLRPFDRFQEVVEDGDE